MGSQVGGLEMLINNKRQQMPSNTNIRNLLCIACSLLHVHNWIFFYAVFIVVFASVYST